MPNMVKYIMDIVNLMLHSWCAWSETVIIFFSFSFVVFLLVLVLFAGVLPYYVVNKDTDVECGA